MAFSKAGFGEAYERVQRVITLCENEIKVEERAREGKWGTGEIHSRARLAEAILLMLNSGLRSSDAFLSVKLLDVTNETSPEELNKQAEQMAKEVNDLFNRTDLWRKGIDSYWSGEPLEETK